MSARCGTCRHWEWTGLLNGLCKAAPPTAILLPDGSPAHMWPMTSKSECCGTYTPRPEDDSEAGD